MNPLIGAQIQGLLGRLDIFHLLQVLTGTDQPTDRERKDLAFVHHMLSAPVASDIVWKYIVTFFENKGWSEMFLGYLHSGIEKLTPQSDKPADISLARPALVELLSTILNNENVPTLHALVQCPNCNFLHGATSE